MSEKFSSMSRQNMVPFIDMHCDTLTEANMHFHHDVFRFKGGQLDVEKLAKGGARAQFFAICLPKLTTVRLLGRLYEGDWKHIKRLAGILHNSCNLHPDHLALCSNANDLAVHNEAGRIGVFLTVEDGRDIGGNLRRLSLYYRLGVRLITLTWNFPNCFGYPNNPYGKKATAADMKKGLTRFGKEAVGEMNRLKILIDVSHLSDGGFWDVSELSKKPFIASHSNCRAICNHPRNLTDEQIRAVAESGGVVGLNQCPGFLRDHSDRGTLEDCLAHLIHLRDVGGIDCAALGSDFDGCGRNVCMGLEGPHEYPLLAEVLLKNGFSGEQVEKIFYKNVERVIGDCL